MRTFPHVFSTLALGLGCSVGAELDEERADAATSPDGRAGAASSGGTAGATGTGAGGGNAGSAGDAGANLQDGRAGTGGSGGVTTGDGASEAASDATGGKAGSGGNGGTGGECSGADNCNTACAKTGETCAGDCDIACGFNGIGNKHCTCMGGVYIQCPCPRPSDFAVQVPAIAPYCDVLLGGDGMMASYKDLDCTTEWKACIARDPNTGTPRGCVCMQDPDADLALRWSCGSTNKWFGPPI